VPTVKSSGVTAPKRLTSHYDLTQFTSGRHGSLDSWLRDRALASEGLSARTYVICSTGAPTRVVGYYAISTVMAHPSALPTAKLRRSRPFKKLPDCRAAAFESIDRPAMKPLGRDACGPGLRVGEGQRQGLPPWNGCFTAHPMKADTGIHILSTISSESALGWKTGGLDGTVQPVRGG